MRRSMPVGLLSLVLCLGCGQAPPSVPSATSTSPGASKTPVAKPLEKPAEQPTVPTKSQPVGLVLVLDRSGSMTGEKFEQAKKACLSAIATLKKEDRVAIVLFDSEAKLLVELGDTTRPDLAQAVKGMQPGGGTNIKPGLEMAARLIPDGDVRYHIVLMSDGMAPTEGLDEVVRNLRHRGITLSAVALGEEADRQLLRNLAESGGGTFHDVALPAELETVFVQEASDRSRAGQMNPVR